VARPSVGGSLLPGPPPRQAVDQAETEGFRDRGRGSHVGARRGGTAERTRSRIAVLRRAGACTREPLGRRCCLSRARRRQRPCKITKLLLYLRPSCPIEFIRRIDNLLGPMRDLTATRVDWMERPCRPAAVLRLSNRLAGSTAKSLQPARCPFRPATHRRVHVLRSSKYYVGLKLRPRDRARVRFPDRGLLIGTPCYALAS
jgi:hypothetical protein